MCKRLREIQNEIFSRVAKGEKVLDILLKLGLTNDKMASGGFIRVMYHGKYNYVSNRSGKFLSSVWFDWVDLFDNGFGKIQFNDKYNYIRRDGELLSPFEWFDFSTCFIGSRAIIKNGIRDGYVSRDGIVEYEPIK